MAARRDPQRNMPVMGHLREFRNRLIVSLLAFLACFGLAIAFSNQLIEFFLSPFGGVPGALPQRVVMGDITEGFTVQLGVAAGAGLVASLPVHLFNLLRFIFPGLGPKVRRIILAYLVASLALVVLGAWLAYYRVLPAAIQFLTDPYFLPRGVGVLLQYGTNVNFVFSFVVWAVIAFQTPLVLELLLMLGLVTRRALLKASRFIIVGIFIFAAAVTPSPDFVSQLGVALPMTALFYLAILVAKVFRWGEG